MSKNDLYYAAGLVDGEGTVTLIRQTRHQKRSPSISVSSTSEELVDFMKDTFGGHIVKLKPPKKGHRQAWHWQTSHDNAIKTLKQIAPYLRERKKKARANLILRDYKRVTPRNGKYTEKQLKRKEEFATQFFEI